MLEVSDPGQSEILSSWALFIQVTLLILALFCSYYLQLKKIQAVHETVISIFAGMVRTGGGGGGGGTHLRGMQPGELTDEMDLGMFVGLIIRLTSSEHFRSLVKFDYQIFFNVLLPPIILNSGYELHQVCMECFALASRSF
jgi:sodium/hydrogen exchanger-like protein 6/7